MCLHNFDIQCINTILFILHTMNKLYLYQYIKILLVCLSVCDGCGCGRNEFAGRVQNYRVPCAKLSRAIQLSQKFSRDVKAAAGQDTQSCRLREGCHCGHLPSH